jgi:hypothetical protein
MLTTSFSAFYHNFSELVLCNSPHVEHCENTGYSRSLEANETDLVNGPEGNGETSAWG